MLTYQDFIAETNKAAFINQAIREHIASEMYKTAKIADEYDRHKNVTINEYTKVIYNLHGTAMEDYIAANNKIASNFFRRLNTQRCTYSLGNGVSFSDHLEKGTDEEGNEITIDTTKKRLGNRFDTDLKKTGYKALIHGVCFGYWAVNRLHVFPITEFKPIWDEDTGILRVGIRFWRLDEQKPMIAVLYEEDGYTKYSAKDGSSFKVVVPKKKYQQTISHTVADGDIIVGESNYGSLPIVPLWGSDLHQSTLIGMRESIDSYDLIRSGFVNDLEDVSQVYWILENYGGMKDSDLQRFRNKIKRMHIAEVDTSAGGKITPYTQEIPHEAREKCLAGLRAGIYEDFGALDVHTVAAGATNDHIDAAYQPMDENADDFEFQVIEFVQQILKLIGIEDTPVFKRNRISNQSEQTQMVLLAADHLDTETILSKLPFISVDEIPKILARRDAESHDRLEDTEDNTEKEVMPQ